MMTTDPQLATHVTLDCGHTHVRHISARLCRLMQRSLGNGTKIPISCRTCGVLGHVTHLDQTHTISGL